MTAKVDMQTELDVRLRETIVTVRVRIPQDDLARIFPWTTSDVLRPVVNERIPATTRLYTLADLVARCNNDQSHFAPAEGSGLPTGTRRALDLTVDEDE